MPQFIKWTKIATDGQSNGSFKGLFAALTYIHWERTASIWLWTHPHAPPPSDTLPWIPYRFAWSRPLWSASRGTTNALTLDDSGAKLPVPSIPNLQCRGDTLINYKFHSQGTRDRAAIIKFTFHSQTYITNRELIKCAQESISNNTSHYSDLLSSHFWATTN